MDKTSPRVKRGPDDLAILGGTPAFAEPLHVGRPNIGDRAVLMRRIDDLLDRKWLTNAGKYVGEFERHFADSVGARHCVAMCNGTIALEIVTRALGMRGEVHRPLVHLRRDGSRPAVAGDHPGLLRHRSGDLQRRSRAGGGDDHSEDDGNHRRTPMGEGVRRRSARGHRASARPSASLRRGARLRVHRRRQA